MQRTELSTLGEFGLIKHLTQNNKTRLQSTIKSIGDDSAVLDFKNNTTVVTTDILVEGLHFDLSYTPLKHLGYKAVAVNVSDICAMFATPSHITVSIAVSNRFSVEALDELYEGIYQACSDYNIDLVGGDTTSSIKGLFISITALGYAHEKEIVYRNTAKEGDIICLSGDVGAAYLGLQVLEREKAVTQSNPGIQPILDKYTYMVQRQLKPNARIDLIQFLKSKQIQPTSMIDVSDGVSSELIHICSQSNVGCQIEEEFLPIANECITTALELNVDPMTCALNGGEDYELLFTIDAKDKEIIENAGGITIIGEIVSAEMGIKIRTRSGNLYNLTAQGWNHYATK